MFNGSDFSGHLKGAFESLGHNFAIEEVSLDNLSSRQVMQPSCTVCCVGDEVMKSQASLYVLAESLEFKSSVFLIPRNAIELALLLGRMGCERVFPIPENTSDSDAWLFVATQVQQLIGAVSSREGARKSMIFSDPKSKSMLALIERVAGVEVSTLLTGESGVGKEVVATILHKMSARARKPFIAVNCAAIPENLVESFLFGHCKGAFTGAVKDQPGVFEEADGGIVFWTRLVSFLFMSSQNSSGCCRSDGQRGWERTRSTASMFECSLLLIRISMSWSSRKSLEKICFTG